MGKGKVSEQEVWMMKGMYWDGMSIKDISSELSRSTTTIEKYLDLKDEPESEEKPNKNNTTMFVRSSAAKNNNSVTIMSAPASASANMSANTIIPGSNTPSSTISVAAPVPLTMRARPACVKLTR